jgi:hypothetical protein
MGLLVNWLVEGWKHSAHPMCAIQFNGGTVQQYGVGKGEVFSILDLLIATSPQFIARVYFVRTQENHLKGFRLSHQCTLADA